MDIRNFFGEKKSIAQNELSSSSTLSALKQTTPTTPQPKVIKRSKKINAKVPDNKAESLKKLPIAVVELSEDDDSEGECPIPSTSTKERSEQKRSLRLLISDSDDDYVHPCKSLKGPVRSTTPPLKPAAKSKRSRVVVYDSDEDQSPAKKQSKHETATALASNDEETSETDSENEFVEKKKKKDHLPPGQKQLVFEASAKRSGAVTARKKPAEKLQRVSAADFFGNDKEAKHFSAKATKVSPSQKENKLAKEDELAIAQEMKSELSEKAPARNKSRKKIEKESKTSEAMLPKDSAKVHKGAAALTESEKLKSPAASMEFKIDKGEVSVPWVDKYKPKNASHLVGQHGDKSPMNKLLGWLKDWGRHNLGDGGKVKKVRLPPYMAQTDGGFFKAVLLSGSPGVGKTTCAVMACDNLGLKTVEMNASDVRSKKSLEQQITQLTGSHQIEEYFLSLSGGKASKEEVKHVLVMDEVDGMSGTEDRAGVAELIQIIKDTKIPIICICNDRQHPKIRSLANHCFDIRFQKPRVEQIRSRLMSIACQEKVKISKEELDQMIELSGHDVRQSIYNLQLYASAGGVTKVQKKDVAVGPFEAVRKLLDSRSSLQEKQDMFFVDYNIMPLFVQENYINLRNEKHTPQQVFARLRKAADLISYSDTIERCIRSTGTWKLLNEQAMLGCALPSIAVDGHLRAMIQFPAWLGKNSTANKRQRLMRQLALHAHLKISADMYSLVTDYLPILRDCLTKPLLERETDGVFEVVCTMNEYDLMREDSEAVSELAVWPGKIDPASKILPKVKAALTRALNKEHRMLPYATEDMSKGRKKVAQLDYEVELDEDGNLVERMDGSSFEDDSEDEDYKPGGKSKAKAKPPATTSRGHGRGTNAVSTLRGARRSRGK